MNKKEIEKIVKENNGQEVQINESEKFFIRIQMNSDKTFSKNHDPLDISFLSEGEIDSLENTHIYIFKNESYEKILEEGKTSSLNQYLHHTYIVQFDNNNEKIHEVFAFADCPSKEKDFVTKNIVEKLFNKKIANF